MLYYIYFIINMLYFKAIKNFKKVTHVLLAFFSSLSFSIVNYSFESNSDILTLHKNSSLNKKTGDFSPVQIQLLKIKPTHRYDLQYNRPL
ncbi:hypothetical protein D8845_04535 [Streptococcus mitis]|uniref:Uncharacterized protein n=1 Tax=Streptococcus mitis TaxID=28037 RepID=A0A3R9QR40_STRMT|nr:hypothetical protein D8845_04535 [Streptococcus mitis]